jgi:two-component system response regulator
MAAKLAGTERVLERTDMSTVCSPYQILLAEDNPADVGLVRHALREHQVDCELQVIGDGEEVLSFIDRLDLDSTIPCPHLVLLDMDLPKRDGKEILWHLRKRALRTSPRRRDVRF